MRVGAVETLDTDQLFKVFIWLATFNFFNLNLMLTWQMWKELRGKSICRLRKKMDKLVFANR